MANINFKHGNLTNMPESMTIGTVYFAIGNNNVGKIYFDAPNGQRFLMGEGIPVEENTNIYQINVAQANNSVNDLFGNAIHTNYIHDIRPADPNSNNAGKLLITRFNNDGKEYSEAIDLSTVSAGGTASFTTIHKMFVTSEENQKEFSDSSLDFSDYVSVGVYVNGYKIPHSEVN